MFKFSTAHSLPNPPSKRQKLSHSRSQQSHEGRLFQPPSSSSLSLLLPGLLSVGPSEPYEVKVIWNEKEKHSVFSSLTASTSSFKQPTMSPAAYRNNWLSVVIKGACAKGDHPYEKFFKWIYTRVVRFDRSLSGRQWWEAVLYVDEHQSELQGGKLVEAIADAIVNMTQRPDTQRKIITRIF